MQTQITISAYRRIIAAGFDIEVKHASHQFRVLLKNDRENVAIAYPPRCGGMSAATALEKATLNTWGRTSEFNRVLERFADIAESLAAKQ